MSTSILLPAPCATARPSAAVFDGCRRSATTSKWTRRRCSAGSALPGDDATRLAAIGRAAASGADVTLISRGGYGLSRLLPDLPWRAIARAAERGTHWVGFSDFTALQLGLLARHPATTWAGPALCEGFGAADGTDAGEGHGGDATTSGAGRDHAGVFRGPHQRLRRRHRLAPAGGGPESAARRHGGVLADHGVLWGGNLAMVTSLLGTPWWPEIKGGVLFLEDVGEHPYRIERMLTQLLHAGVLARQKLIVLGRFTDYSLTPHDRGYSLAKVVDWLRAQLKAPVLTGLPFGHVPTKVLLPVGQPVQALVEGRDALLLWGHLH
jgi:muramoyltetrapeptide carboxypeptidase